MFQTFETTANPQAVAERVKALRGALAAAGIDAFLVPRADAHQGEYVPAHAERLKWISGFTGSAGLAVITRKTAALFTDGRYTVQAKAETDSAVYQISFLARPRLAEWLSEHLTKGQTIGFDPWLHTLGEITRLQASLAPKGIALKPLGRNPIDRLWGKDQPKLPANPVIVQPVGLAGRSGAEKIAELQKKLKDDGQHAAVLTLPDSICWLLNIRGSDIPHNPVALAFAIVPASGKAELFIDASKIGKDVRTHLSATAKIVPPGDLLPRLKALRAAGLMK